MGFEPDIYTWREGNLVRLPEGYRKTAVLIGTGLVGSDDEIDPWGTGFLVDNQRPGGSYLVTAAHMVTKNGRESPFEIRFNKHGGGAKNHHVQNPHWAFHPSDNTVDVAVHQLDVPEWADCNHIPWTDSPAQKKPVPVLLLDNRFESKDIGAGNRTYTVGLWKFLKGDRRNQTFVYTGHIGLVPEGQGVSVEPWLPEHCGQRVLVSAYLVEGEPLDGASGSPVFVRRSVRIDVVPRGETKPVMAVVEGSIWCLGLQSDSYQGRASQDYSIPQSGMIPRGVNVVVPSQKIVEVLVQDMLKKQREQSKLDAEIKGAPLKTSSHAIETNPKHREDFSRLLNVAAKKPKQDD